MSVCCVSPCLHLRCYYGNVSDGIIKKNEDRLTESLGEILAMYSRHVHHRSGKLTVSSRMELVDEISGLRLIRWFVLIKFFFSFKYFRKSLNASHVALDECCQVLILAHATTCESVSDSLLINHRNPR